MSPSRRRALRLLLIGAVVILLAAIATVGRTVNVADQAQACIRECRSVQAGLDAYMAVNNLASVPASNGTNNMTAPVPLYTRHPTPTNPTFIATSRTQWRYGWQSTGRVMVIETADGGPALPVGCKPSGA